MNKLTGFTTASLLALSLSHCAMEAQTWEMPMRNSGSLCERACARIYDTCHLSLGTSSGALSRSQCVEQCRAGGIDGYEACLSEVSCNRDAVAGCFLSVPVRPTNPPPSTLDAGVDSGSPSDGGFSILDSGTPPPPPPPPPAAYNCATACAHIYTVCNARLSSNGSTLTQAQCETMCAGDSRYSNNVECLSTMTCGAAEFSACLSGTGNPPPPPPPPPPATDAGVRDVTTPPPPPPGMCPALSAPFGRNNGQSIPDFNGRRCSDGASVNYRNNVWCGARLTIVATGSFT
ncbi:MAG: hypothetical protein Q8Q09_19560 [Deltaproteobacteria bacterium]|nr:hypothetical protein [Deltaproteobacteria bacterium]